MKMILYSVVNPPVPDIAVPGWEACTGVQPIQPAGIRCKPAEKPDGCSNYKWNQLFGEPNLGNELTDCLGLSLIHNENFTLLELLYLHFCNRR